MLTQYTMLNVRLFYAVLMAVLERLAVVSAWCAVGICVGWLGYQAYRSLSRNF